MLIFALLVVLLWVVLGFLLYRVMSARSRGELEGSMHFRVSAAPWSDHYLQTLLARAPTSEVVLQQYVRNAIERKDWPEAERRLELFRKRRPRSPYVLLRSVEISYATNQAEQALATLRKGMFWHPGSSDFRLGYARDAVRRKDRAEALRRFASFRRRFPQRFEAYREAALLLCADGHRSEAEALITEGMRRLPEEKRLWAGLGEIAVLAGDDEGAIAHWEALRLRNPSSSFGWIRGAEALARLGRLEDAAALVREARDFFPADKDVAALAQRLAAAPAADDRRATEANAG